MRAFLAAFLLLTLGTAHAALIDNGSYTTDDVAGLDWLDLTATADMTMVDALAANSGWRLATQSEVASLFNQIFTGYYNTNEFNTSRTDDPGGAYAGQLDDIFEFVALFGATSPNPYPNTFAWGLFIDPDGIVRMSGVYEEYSYNQVAGAYHTRDYAPYYDDWSNSSIGTYLVRTAAVPIPAAAWLFASGLGLLGWLRRRRVS